MDADHRPTELMTTDPKLIILKELLNLTILINFYLREI